MGCRAVLSRPGQGVASHCTAVGMEGRRGQGTTGRWSVAEARTVLRAAVSDPTSPTTQVLPALLRLPAATLGAHTPPEWTGPTMGAPPRELEGGQGPEWGGPAAAGRGVSVGG